MLNLSAYLAILGDDTDGGFFARFLIFGKIRIFLVITGGILAWRVQFYRSGIGGNRNNFDFYGKTSKKNLIQNHLQIESVSIKTLP